jgi:hypothetical protein
MPFTFRGADSALLGWLQNLYSVGNPLAVSLGLTTAAFTALNTETLAFQAALALCEPGPRSKANVIAKNSARSTVKTTAKLMVNVIDGQATVSESTKSLLGISTRKPPMPTPIPTIAPTIAIASVSAFTAKVRLSTPNKKRGKPDFVIGASFFSFTGDAPPTDISQWKFEGNTGKPVFEVQFSNTLAKGTTVFLTAFWFNGAKLSGPCATPISCVIQGGGVTLVAETNAA